MKEESSAGKRDHERAGVTELLHVVVTPWKEPPKSFLELTRRAL